jgi:hypothetical protein
MRKVINSYTEIQNKTPIRALVSGKCSNLIPENDVISTPKEKATIIEEDANKSIFL